MRGLSAPARRAGCVAAAVLIAAVAGCEEPRGDVTGMVSFRGKPVVYGTVSVIGPDQMSYYGVIQNDGTFAVRQVPVGPVKLGVYSPDPYFELPVPPAVKAAMEKARKAAANGEELPKPPKGVWFRLPGKYADPTGSGLAGEVTSPVCTIDVRME